MDANQLSSAVAKFSVKFLDELEKGESVVSSPLSAEILLALITLGCTEPAHNELLTSLGIPDDEAIRSAFSSLTTKLKSTKGITLNSANKVYIKEGEYDLESSLKEDAIKVFDAEFQKLNFNNSTVAAKTINEWVESKTNNRIKDLLSSDSFDDDTRLVLVNALYFKGTWQKQFNSESTEDRPFHIDSKHEIKVPTMYIKSRFNYGRSEELQAQLLQMYYAGNEASMIIVLPNEIEGLNDVIKKLAGGYNLLEEINKMFDTEVEVYIPKFKIETEIDLKEVLPKLGISSIFSTKYSGLTKILNKDEPLYVSKAIQKAFIEVNEEGSEAAAATAMVMMMCSALIQVDPVIQFDANRPFLAIIFAGSTPFFVATHRG